jgi:DNA-binding NarL/FixJ family response regulator
VPCEPGPPGTCSNGHPQNELVDAIRLVHGREAVLFPDALRRIAAPHHGTATSRPSLELTPRELAVLRQIARGQNNAEIAATLFVSRETVKTHVRNLLDKLNARDRTQAVVRAYELGIVIAGAEIPSQPP